MIKYIAFPKGFENVQSVELKNNLYVNINYKGGAAKITFTKKEGDSKC